MLQWLSKNKFLKTAVLLGAVIAAVFIFSASANAASVADSNSTLNQGVQIIQQPLGLPAFDIRIIIANIIRVLLGLLGIVLVVLMMYAGYLWMTAGGNEEQIAQAKNIIKNAVIGLAIILSAYAIVTFIFNMLGVGGGGEGGGGINPPVTENLAGSGALGRTVKDHYPARDQKNVPRNSKILISFFKPLKPESFITDTNGDGIFGDCVNTNDVNFSWNVNCDHVVTTTAGLLSDAFINVKNKDTKVPILGLVALVSTSTENGVTGAFTLVLKPITSTSTTDLTGGYLGSETEDVGYTVYLGNGILVDDPLNNNPRLFASSNPNNDHYNWNFTCNTTLDLTPPHIVGVYPDESTLKDNKAEVKNTVIQISFSEPVDPIGLQGSMRSSSPFDGNFIVNSSNSNSLYLTNSSTNILPKGSWNLINNFQTLEFTPTEQCGKNVCGDPVYCLPVCDPGSINCPIAHYKILLKTASTTGTGFIDRPFSGIEDLAGNAFDGNNDGVRQNPSTILPIFDNWATPDNYKWSFNIKNDMDLTPPYLIHVEPSIIESFVQPKAPWKMQFNKRMRVDSFYGVDILEYPLSTNNVDLYKDPHAQVETGYTWVDVSHGDFLKVNNKRYMPIATSSIQDSHFNCFYPGLGPNTHYSNNGTTVNLTQNCLADGSNCCAVSDTAGANFCCNGAATSSQGGKDSCYIDGRDKYYTQ